MTAATTSKWACTSSSLTTSRPAPQGQGHRQLPKDHTHLFVNADGDLQELDFRFALGAPFNGLKAFFTTPQLDWLDKLRNALALGTDPIVRGLVDYEGAMKVIRDLDRISFQEWFLGHGGSEQSIRRMWNPVPTPSASSIARRSRPAAC